MDAKLFRSLEKDKDLPKKYYSLQDFLDADENYED